MIEHLRSISQATATAKGRVAVVIMDRAEQHGIPLEKLNVLIISFHSNCITAIFSRA
jgi:type III secretion system FlhB-like substrate exporter